MEWAWGIMRAHCHRANTEEFDDPMLGSRPDCVIAPLVDTVPGGAARLVVDNEHGTAKIVVPAVGVAQA